MAHATRLKKADPNFDFKTANPIDAATSSRRSSKRMKRPRDESDDDEEENSQLQTPADQHSDHTDVEDTTLVSDQTQVEIFTEADDDAHAIAQQNNDQAQGQDHQLAGVVPTEDQAQPPVDQVNNYDGGVDYQGGNQVQDSIHPVDHGVQEIANQEMANQQQHQREQDYRQAQLQMERANFANQSNQLAMMQQNSFHHRPPQTS